MSTPVVANPSIADWLTAIGTVLAVVIALLIAFLGEIRKKLLEPKLKIEFQNKEPFCRNAVIIDEEVPTKENLNVKRHPQGYFLRLRIRNEGKSIARDVEARLVRILDADSHKEKSDYDPTHLRWIGYGNSNAISIPRGLYEYASVCFVKDSDPSLFLATTETAPRGFSLVRQRSDCILHIVVVGTNAKPIERYFKLHFGSGFAVKYDDVSLTEIHLNEN